MSGAGGDSGSGSGPVEFSRRIKCADIGVDAVRRTLTPSVAECANLAARFRVTGLAAVTVEVTLWQYQPGVIRIEGAISADVTLTDPVSATVMDFLISEQFSEVLATRKGAERLAETASDEEIDAEYIADEGFDLGEVAAQNLSLFLEPVMLEAGRFDDGAATWSAGPEAGAETDSEADSGASGAQPFAVLARLRDKGSGSS